jgi:hypothetical protein
LSISPESGGCEISPFSITSMRAEAFFFVFPFARALTATALFTNANFCRFSTRDVKILQRNTWHQNGAAIYCGFITAR